MYIYVNNYNKWVLGYMIGWRVFSYYIGLLVIYYRVVIGILIF